MLINMYTTMLINQFKNSTMGADIIRAYPKEFKPTRMLQPTVTVSPISEEMEYVGIGEHGVLIKPKISVCVFVPIERGLDELEQMVDTVEANILTGETCKIKAGTPTVSKAQGTISAEIIVTFERYFGD